MPNGTSALEREKVKPLRSSPTLPVTEAKIGPSGGLEQLLRGEDIRPDPRGEGDPRSGEELFQRLGETPVGNILTMYLSHKLGGNVSLPDFSGSGAIPAVTAFDPGKIRQSVIAAYNKLMKASKEGLQRRSMGLRPLTMDAITRGVSADVASEADYHPNTILSDKAVQDLRIAQERWPRIFGHINDFTDVDAITQLKHAGNVAGTASDLMGRERALLPPDVKADKLSSLRLSPGVMNRSLLRGQTEGQAITDTIGHELSHVADKIRLGKKMLQLYDQENATAGYDKNIYEQRARAMGERFQKIVEETERQGGGRSFLGKNPRVPTKRLTK